MLVVVPLLTSVAAAQALRLVDADGVVHVTNLPTDPRYRGVAGGSANAGKAARQSTAGTRRRRLIADLPLKGDLGSF